MNNCRRFFGFVFFLVFFVAAFFGEEEEIVEEPWVLGAQKFTFSENRSNSKMLESVAAAMPKLILAQISSDTTRSILRDEQVARKLDELLTERLALFIDLSKAVKERDALVLNNYTVFEYQNALKEKEEKIKEIQEKIDKNLETQQNALFPPPPKNRREEKKQEKEWLAKTENVSLYKDDAESLFEPSDEAKKSGMESRAFAKEISSAKISGLLCGGLTAYGNYISVSVDLYSFPGAKKIDSVVEVGYLSEIRQIAENIAFKLLPKIANSLPVEIEFNFFPEEVFSTAELTIDNIVYNTVPKKILLSSGVHSISVEAKNYTRESFVYNFSDESKFLIEINFKEKSDGTVKIRLKEFLPGAMFFDGRLLGETEPSSFINVPIRVNGKTVFGYFEGTVNDKDGERSENMFMMIPADLMVDGAELETKMRVIDVSKNIDKRRRMLYISYTALLMTLPFMFYSYGKFLSHKNSYVLGYGNVSYDEADHYRKLSLVGVGLVSGCGAWMLAELVAYLFSVEKVFPQKARKISNRNRINTKRKKEG